jgi:hypothetical protein
MASVYGRGIFIDATAFGSVVTDPEQSSVVGKVGCAPSPRSGCGTAARP